jgi:hypothetical protein
LTKPGPRDLEQAGPAPDNGSGFIGRPAGMVVASAGMVTESRRQGEAYRGLGRVIRNSPALGGPRRQKVYWAWAPPPCHGSGCLRIGRRRLVGLVDVSAGRGQRPATPYQPMVKGRSGQFKICRLSVPCIVENGQADPSDQQSGCGIGQLAFVRAPATTDRRHEWGPARRSHPLMGVFRASAGGSVEIPPHGRGRSFVDVTHSPVGRSAACAGRSVPAGLLMASPSGRRPPARSQTHANPALPKWPR